MTGKIGDWEHRRLRTVDVNKEDDPEHRRLGHRTLGMTLLLG
jgi:hypothetical protein